MTQPDIRPPLDELKTRIHVGCGPNALKPNWLNVDIRPFAGVDQVCDITQPWDGLTAVEYVYGEHFIEHLSLEQALAFLRHAAGAMIDGGRIRLSTPALEWVIATHFHPGEQSEPRMLAQTFGINRAFHGWGHRFLWSRAMLEKALGACGFQDIAFLGYGESDHETLRGIEEHGGYKVQNGFPSTWIVEGARRGDLVTDDAFLAAAEQEFTRYVRSGH